VASLINELKETRSEKKLYTLEKKFEKYGKRPIISWI
jgi:hypothetical protein